MHRVFLVAVLFVGGIVVEAAGQAAASAGGRAVRITNANLQPVAAAGALTTQFRGLVERHVEPAWIAYVQPSVDGKLASCCWGWGNDNGRSTCCVGCPLEGRSGVTSISDHTGEAGGTAPTGQAGPIKLEGSGEFVMLFRIEQKRIDKVRLFSSDCELDAGGRVVHLLTGVSAPESIALLESIVASWPEGDRERKNVPDATVMGIAMHRDAGADAALGRLIAPAQPEDIRRKALFWTARARGRSGFETARSLLREDASPRMRKHAVSALAQSKEPDVSSALIDAARTSADIEVRGESLFWLAQKAGRQAEEAITRAIEEDPETKVKERAVFALSQLPRERSVPLLIDVAKTNKNPAVRKRAMFWLGQSKDPRAIDFFEQILR